MSKYHRLTTHLANLNKSYWRASFDEIEQVLGFELPASAHEHPAWWANQAGGHAQSSSWQDAGWRTENLDLENKSITFVRRNAFAGIAPFHTGLGEVRAVGTADPRSGLSQPVHPLTIAQAKAGLAANFGVPEENIEIIIKG